MNADHKNQDPPVARSPTDGPSSLSEVHPTAPMLASASTFTGVKVAAKATVAKTARRANVVTRAGQYDDELLETAVRRVFFSIDRSSRRVVASRPSPTESASRACRQPRRADVPPDRGPRDGGCGRLSAKRTAGFLPRSESLGRRRPGTTTGRRRDDEDGTTRRSWERARPSFRGRGFPPHGIRSPACGSMDVVDGS